MEAAEYVLDPNDPRAPSQELWDRLSPSERHAVVDALPSEFQLFLPEGDPHRRSKTRAYEMLDEHFRRIRRSIYLSSELPVYYPGESVFAPDLIAVLDVEPHDRMRWTVSDEQKGLDFVLESQHNVERCARLGIPEYFAFDSGRGRLLGWKLGESGRYVPIMPQGGRWASAVLGLDLAVLDGRLRFFHGGAELLDARELITQLSTMVDDAVERAEASALRAEQEHQRAEQESQRAERLAARLRELGVDP